MVSSKGNAGLALLVAFWLPYVKILSEKEAKQQQAKSGSRDSLYPDVSIELMKPVFPKQVYPLLERFWKKTDSCLLVVFPTK
jgi:hypothetical protein